MVSVPPSLISEIVEKFGRLFLCLEATDPNCFSAKPGGNPPRRSVLSDGSMAGCISAIQFRVCGLLGSCGQSQIGKRIVSRISVYVVYLHSRGNWAIGDYPSKSMHVVLPFKNNDAHIPLGRWANHWTSQELPEFAPLPSHQSIIGIIYKPFINQICGRVVIY